MQTDYKVATMSQYPINKLWFEKGIFYDFGTYITFCSSLVPWTGKNTFYSSERCMTSTGRLDECKCGTLYLIYQEESDDYIS